MSCTRATRSGPPLGSALLDEEGLSHGAAARVDQELTLNSPLIANSLIKPINQLFWRLSGPVLRDNRACSKKLQNWPSSQKERNVWYIAIDGRRKGLQNRLLIVVFDRFFPVNGQKQV